MEGVEAVEADAPATSAAPAATNVISMGATEEDVMVGDPEQLNLF